MTFYTDYPIKELGDKDGQSAPLRECQIKKYDGDKYCDIEVHNVETSIKAGYVYIDENKTQISKNFLKIFT